MSHHEHLYPFNPFNQCYNQSGLTNPVYACGRIRYEGGYITVITEHGIVIGASGEKADVRIQKRSACAHCESRGSCEITKRDVVVEVTNSLHAAIGDTVELRMQEGTLLKVSFLVYVLPVLALMAGAFAGAAAGAPLSLDPSVSALMGGGFLMALTYVVIRRIDRSARTTASYQARITRILISSDVPRSGDNR